MVRSSRASINYFLLLPTKRIHYLEEWGRFYVDFPRTIPKLPGRSLQFKTENYTCDCSTRYSAHIVSFVKLDTVKYTFVKCSASATRDAPNFSKNMQRKGYRRNWSTIGSCKLLDDSKNYSPDSTNGGF